MDGDIDYSTFARHQLQEALTRIDRARFPKNYENLVRELEGRPPEPSAARHTSDVRKWIRLLGWYQLLATSVFLYEMIKSGSLDLAGLHKLSTLQIVIVFAAFFVIYGLIAITGLAGILILRGHRLGVPLSIVGFCAQAVSLTIPSFSYRWVPFVGLHVYYSSAAFGVRAVLGPDSKISWGGGAQDLYIGIDLLAVAAVVLLSKFPRRHAAS